MQNMEPKYTTPGAAMADFSLAVNRIYICILRWPYAGPCMLLYVHIVAWSRLAQAAGQYPARGQPVFMEGTLHVDATGRRPEEVKPMSVAQNIPFLGGGKADDPEGTIRMTIYHSNRITVPFHVL